MQRSIILKCYILILIFLSTQATLYECVQKAMTQTCRQQLYLCTNNPQCSYQLHQNTKHIKLTKQSYQFPSLYFSNPIARTLYNCLQSACHLPNIDQSYPSTLPVQYCMFEVWDICGGNLQEVYQKKSSPQFDCYKKYCPTL